METRTGVGLPVGAPRRALVPVVSGEVEVLYHGKSLFWKMCLL